MLTTLEKAVAWSQTKSMWPDTFGLACCAMEMMSIVSSRYDIARFGMEAFRSSPRQADLLIVSGPCGAQDGRPDPPDLRPDAGAEVGDRDGRLRQLGRHVQQLRDPAGRRQDHRRRRPRPRLPTSAGGADRGHHPPAREGPGRRPARVRDPRRSRPDLTKASPGSSRRRTRTARRRSSSIRRACVEACTYLRDVEGFNFLSDITPRRLPRLGRMRASPATTGTAAGRDLNTPNAQGYARPARAEAEALRGQLPPARARGPSRAASASRSGSTRARASRASSRSGRPPTGTSGRPGT